MKAKTPDDFPHRRQYGEHGKTARRGIASPGGYLVGSFVKSGHRNSVNIVKRIVGFRTGQKKRCCWQNAISPEG